LTPHVSELGYAASVEMSGCAPELPWDVCVVNNMVPAHRAIGEFESWLELEAARLGGRNDGWGCFSQRALQGYD
jgi:hypothetical protein